MLPTWTVLEIIIFFKGSKYLLPCKILSRKLDLFGRKILMTKDNPLPETHSSNN